MQYIGLSFDATGDPFAVRDPLGITAAAVVEVSDWQHKSTVFVMFVRGVIDGTKSCLYNAVPFRTLALLTRPWYHSDACDVPIANCSSVV